MEDTTQRLNKYLANLGIASRRNIAHFLKHQNVTVNGQRVKESGTRIDPHKDTIRINGEKIKSPQLVYFLLNKPKGVISTTNDEHGRKNVLSLLPTKERIYPVGRLDKDTTGLLILTNDGDLTNLLIHPKYHVNKVYQLEIDGLISKAQLHALRNGVLLEDGITAPAEVIILREKNNVSFLEITIHEGRNRQIRRMCETVGLKLVSLKRVKFGPLTINSLKEGDYRKLTTEEINLLRKAATPKK